MADLIHEITMGLRLAQEKGCPVESIRVNKATFGELMSLPGSAGTNLSSVLTLMGHRVSVVQMKRPWAIMLECGWTNHLGHERHGVIPEDLITETIPQPTNTAPTLDITQPMMIEGDPDTRVTIEGDLTWKGDYPVNVYSNGTSCMAFIKPDGNVTSATWEGRRVINRSRHETIQADHSEMETNPLWASF